MDEPNKWINYPLIKDETKDSEHINLNQIEQLPISEKESLIKVRDYSHLNSFKIKSQSGPEENILNLTKILLKSSIPSIFSLLFVYLLDNLNLIFANVYLSRESVSAVGVGTLYINATGFFVGLGLLGGVDTLCSQAYGAKSYYLMGLYANISRIVIIGFFIFVILPFILMSEYLLELIGQPAEIMLLTTHYIRSMIPSIFFSLQFYASLHYLQAMNTFTPGMIITLMTASVHSLWLFIFLGIFGCDIKGIGYAMGISNTLNYILITAYIHYYNPEPQTYFCFDQNSVSIRRIFDFLQMAVTSAIMFSADWLGFQIVILLSTYLDLTSLNANVCLFNFLMLLLTIPGGISFAATILVGNSLGRNKVQAAEIYSWISCIVGVTGVVFLALLATLFKEDFPYIYTNDPEVAIIFREFLNFIVYFSAFDALQLILNGVLKGLGKQKPASFLVLFILYPINIPMSITYAFSLNYGLMGLWYSQLTAVIFLNFAYLIMIVCLDWENNAVRTIIKINKITESLNQKNILLEMDKNKHNK